MFTLEAIATCAEHGHYFAFVRTWGDVGLWECTRCGESRAPDAPLPGGGVVPPPGDAPVVPDPARSRAQATSSNGRAPRAAEWRDTVTGTVFVSADARDAEIRRLAASGLAQVQIAARFEPAITSQRVSQICRRTR